jgi:hypothetical protein
MRRLALVHLTSFALVLSAGCDRGAVRDPVTGVLTFDAAVLGQIDAGEPRADGFVGVDSGPPDAGPIATNPDGVLTNRPDLNFVNTGTQDLVITTAALRMWRRTNDWAVVWAGDYENRGTQTYCIPAFDVRMDGVDVLTIGEGPQYAISSSVGALRYQCLAPGDRGVFYGIEPEMPETFLDTLTSVYYSPSALIRNEAYPDPARPTLVYSEVVRDEEGAWRVETRFRTNSTPIYNFSASTLPRIGGLLWHQMTSYHLNDVFAFTEFTPETFTGYEQPYTEFAVSFDYLVRTGSGRIDPDGEDFRALSTWRADRARARQALNGQR